MVQSTYAIGPRRMPEVKNEQDILVVTSEQQVSMASTGRKPKQNHLKV